MNDFKEFLYHVMPKDQGQNVIRGYAVDDDYLYCQTIDETKKVTFSRSMLDYSNIDFDPVNSQLPEHSGEWETYGGKYCISDDCYNSYSEVIESDMGIDEFKEWCIEKWQEGDWEAKTLVTIRIEKLGWNDKDVLDIETIEVECGEDPPPPDCLEGYDHEWERPYEIVGGLVENPGVFSRGGTTFVFTEICCNCGLKRVEKQYGSQRNPGQCDEIEYIDDDEEAIEWAANNRKEKGE